MKSYVGIDGCKAGWFTVTLFDDQSWKLDVFSNIEEIWKSLSHAEIILIDIPIGLLDKGSKERTCDVKARKLLGPPSKGTLFLNKLVNRLEWFEK